MAHLIEGKRDIYGSNGVPVRIAMFTEGLHEVPNLARKGAPMIGTSRRESIEVVNVRKGQPDRPIPLPNG